MIAASHRDRGIPGMRESVREHRGRAEQRPNENRPTHPRSSRSLRRRAGAHRFLRGEDLARLDPGKEWVPYGMGPARLLQSREPPGGQTIRSPKASVALGRRFFEDDFYPSEETPEGGRVIGVHQKQDAGNLYDRPPPNPSCMTLPFLVTPLPLAVCPGRSDHVIRGGIQRP